MLTPNCIWSSKTIKHDQVSELRRQTVAPKWLAEVIITKEDYKELIETDEEKDWASIDKFQIGQPWPLTTHQWRRSIAFYAANSGLVSMPSLRRQFKHLSLAMSRYYAKGFENLATMFGCYNEKKGK
jgi:hypothetical protein